MTSDSQQTVYSPDLTARRRPVQSRSQNTVARVLDAASSLLTQMPLEDVTTTRIAAEAGLSIGALYRFFPDKQTIVDAIAVRHVEQFRASPRRFSVTNGPRARVRQPLSFPTAAQDPR